MHIHIIIIFARRVSRDLTNQIHALKRTHMTVLVLISQ